MLKTMFVSTLLLSFILINTAHASKKTDAVQDDLDQACQEVRAVALQPLRIDIYNECINKFKKDVKTCQRDADAYDGRRIGGAPRFYELPECQKAFDFREKTNK